MADSAEPRRERSRRDTLRLGEDGREKITTRVLDFYAVDDSNRTEEKERRIQRYAKYRMWSEGKDWPWPESSDVPLSDMMEKSLRMQDTLHNAVMSTRPVINAKSLESSGTDKEETIDTLLDYQFFSEQEGEEIVGAFSEDFVNEGDVTAFIPWVKEMREMSEIRKFEPIPEEVPPVAFFDVILRQEFPDSAILPLGDGWDFEVTEKDSDEFIKVSFYTDEKRNVEMTFSRSVIVYDGPKVIPKEWDDVLFPARAANLHSPGPSNPGGAAHVILVDHPTVDEVARLQKNGTYNLMTVEEVEALRKSAEDHDNKEMKEQKDVLQGVEGNETGRPNKEKSQHSVTRLMCFDLYDAEENGIAEDMIWWVIKDTQVLVRGKKMTELFPSNPPRRPLESESFLPIRGRKNGLSLLDTIEGLHDVIKMLIDQTVDSGTIKNAPFFFYRASGGMKPEIINFLPGEGYPLNDPKNDVEFPTMRFQGEAVAINMITMLQQMEERTTTIGDLQLGRVPQGKSSALRTIGGMAMVAGQGEARPERILRRYFLFLSRVWAQMHERNQWFLPENKKFRILGPIQPGKDVYQEIKRSDEISGRFDFVFKANVLNTSKEGLQQSLQVLLQTYVTELSLQLGMIDGVGIYKLMRDYGLAWGQDVDKYIKEPSPGAAGTRILAEEALAVIMEGESPDGTPAEAGGFIEHLQKLQEFMMSDQVGMLSQPQVGILKAYVAQVAKAAGEEARQQQLLQAAQDFQSGGEPNGRGGRPPEGPPEDPNSPTAVQGGELLDETLPSAGGGGNAGTFGL